jgi:hypothetical protein
MTLYPLPRYLVMVFALEGLSTITSFWPFDEGSDGLGELETPELGFLTTGHSLGG